MDVGVDGGRGASTGGAVDTGTEGSTTIGRVLVGGWTGGSS